MLLSQVLKRFTYTNTYAPETEMECNKTIWDRSVHSFIIGTNTCNKNDKNAETRTINCLGVVQRL